MNIIVVGGGTVGLSLCIDLSQDGHNVVLIDKDAQLINDAMNKADVTGVVGNGAAISILSEAGVEMADVFIAVTDSDELNMIAAMIAHKFGAKRTIARVRDPEYAQDMGFVRRDLGIDLMINPEKEAAKKIYEIIKYPSANNVETFMDGFVSIVEFEIPENNFLVNQSIHSIEVLNKNILICMVERGEEVYIPDGNFVLNAGDRIHITGDIDSFRDFIEKSKISENPVSSVMMIGATDLSYYLTEILSRKGFVVKVISNDYEKALYFADEFPNIQVIYGDGTNHDFLQEEGVLYYDSLVAATSSDEENIVLGIYASNLDMKRVVVKVDQDNLGVIAESLELGAVVNPKKIISDNILHFVKTQRITDSSRIIDFHRMAQERVFGIQFYVTAGYDMLGVPLRELELKDETIIACIRRQNSIIYPTGQDVILEGDQVLVVTKQADIDEIDLILRAKHRGDTVYEDDIDGDGTLTGDIIYE